MYFNDDAGKQDGYSSQVKGNWIGNIAWGFYGTHGGTGNFDGDGDLSDNPLLDYIFEKNVSRSAEGGSTPDSQFRVAPDADEFIFDVEKGDVAWASGAIAVPDSLYRDSAPDWWCQEACDWEGETGIGAFGDDFDETLCKLPAQIRQEAGTCTPLTASSPSFQGGSISGGSLSWSDQIWMMLQKAAN